MRRSRSAVSHRRRDVALTIMAILILAVQVAVLVRYLRSGKEPSLSEQARAQEKQLSSQLQKIQISDAKLKRLSIQVKKTVQELKEHSQQNRPEQKTQPLLKGPEGTHFPPADENGECVGGLQQKASDAVAAVVTITFDRADYLRRHVDSLLAVHEASPLYRQLFPLHISQDGAIPNPKVAEFAKGLAAQGISYLHHREEKLPEREHDPKENLAYYRIANHYKFLMQTFFDCFGYSKLIILEDDMELAPDFFSYFHATSALLDRDKSLFCISSWNDHGQAQFVHNETQLYRSDFFPGLGWMLTKDMWHNVRHKWPRAYWDDWMRLNSTREGRQCIRPEVCRTYNFGARGASKGQFYRRFLAPIRLNKASIDWTKVDLSYLEKSRYDAELNASLAKANRVSIVDEAKNMSGDVNIQYKSQEHYETLTERLGILREWKDGVPRGGYNGVVIVRWGNTRLFFSQAPDFVQPEKSSTTVKVDKTGAIIRTKVKPGIQGFIA